MNEIFFKVERDEESSVLVASWDEPGGNGGITTQGHDLSELQAMVREAVFAFRRLGFEAVRQQGSPIRMVKGERRVAALPPSIPLHPRLHAAQSNRIKPNQTESNRIKLKKPMDSTAAPPFATSVSEIDASAISAASCSISPSSAPSCLRNSSPAHGTQTRNLEKPQPAHPPKSA